DKASADRVSSGKDNWDNRCRLLCCENTYGSPGNNDIDLLPDKLGNDLGCALAASLCPSNLDRDGSTLDPAEFAQPLHESGDPVVLNRTRRWAQEPDSRQFLRLLHDRREWPRGSHAAEQGDEIATFHFEHGRLPPQCAIRAADWPVLSLPQLQPAAGRPA